MNAQVKQRCLRVADYTIQERSTIRVTARKFNVSKTTIYDDLTKRLPRINSLVYKEARKILDINKNERHIRGGMATKAKFAK